MALSLNIKLNFALSMTMHSSMELPKPKHIHYVIKRSFAGDIHLICIRIKNNLRYGYYIEIMKSLTLYHILTREGSPLIYLEFNELSPRSIKNIKDIFDLDTSKFSYWVSHYVCPLQKSLTFHRKYPFFTGKYTVPIGIIIPCSLRNEREVNLMIDELLDIFGSFQSLILDFFSKPTSNILLHQMVLLSVQELFSVYSLIVELSNYVSLITKTQFDPFSHQMVGMKSDLDFIQSKISQNKILSSLIHVELVDPVPIDVLSPLNKPFLDRYGLELADPSKQPIAEPPIPFIQPSLSPSFGSIIME